ncbi:hypothetical protein Tco_0371014 [Tanacetum coccineum]
MTEPTMEEYITITQINHESGHGRGRIELKVDSLNVPNVSHDRISVSIFPVSLTGAASDWFKDESIGSITKWVDLPDKFFAKFYPPSRVGRKVETNEVNKMILWDAVDTKFENWLASKFMSYKTMDGCTKNSLWNYWKKDSKLMDNTKMIGFMNGTTRYHGCMKSHEWLMECGRNLLLLNMIVNHFVLKVDIPSGQLITGEMKDIAMEETFLEHFKLETLSNTKIMNSMKL